MRVRSAAENDLPAILEIYNDAVLNTVATADYEPQTLEMRREWFALRVQKGLPVFVAENEERRVVGWSALSPYHGRVGYRFTAETSIYVAADWRGKGVGRALLPPLIEAARQRGLRALIASIDGTNEASIRLHASCGFEKVGHLKEVITKFGRWLDVVYMERLLCDGEESVASPTDR
jgi:phosphinothricin acetyltransferase